MAPGSAELLAADSFRVRTPPHGGAAEVRGWELHRSRFTRAVLAAWPGAVERKIADRVDAFLDAALTRIAEYGEGFPRLELWDGRASGPNDPARTDPELRLSLRPLPDLRTTIELRTAGPVRLAHRERKGPNIAVLARLNRDLGAEALLLDQAGSVLEGATTSLIWWDEDPTHCFTAPQHRHDGRPTTARVESVTERLILEAASRRRIGKKSHRSRPEGSAALQITPERLAAHEVWAVNALHGIRVVTSIDGVATPDPDAGRLAWFREALERTWTPLPKK